MSRATYVPITPEVLVWAMEAAGVDAPELAEYCDTDPGVVDEWRTGETQPTKTQFRKLVKRLRRASGIYFLPAPPEPDPVLRDFRGPPGQPGGRDLLDVEIRALQTAERLQTITRWIRQKEDSEPIAVPHWERQLTPALKATRAFLSWSVKNQIEASSASEAIRRLREHLEDAGILVLQLPMTQDGCRGFALHDDYAPVIAVNSAYTVEARTFSYMHEFAHLAKRANSICSQSSSTNLEQRCEHFASAFLLPKGALLEYLDTVFGDSLVHSLDEVRMIARHFKVSLRATALRLDRLERAAPGLYGRVDRGADFKKRPGFSGDTGAPAVRLREWGSGFARALLSAERESLLSRTDLLEYFNLSNTQLRELRVRLEEDLLAEG